jgi:hypothetical protein
MKKKKPTNIASINRTRRPINPNAAPSPVFLNSVENPAQNAAGVRIIAKVMISVEGPRGSNRIRVISQQPTAINPVLTNNLLIENCVMPKL